MTAESEFIHEHDFETVTIPPECDSANSKLVYLYLNTVDTATIEQLQITLDMRQLALFPVLDTLQEANLVAREGTTYTAVA